MKNRILENMYLTLRSDFEIKVNVFENPLFYKHVLDGVHVKDRLSQWAGEGVGYNPDHDFYKDLVHFDTT